MQKDGSGGFGGDKRDGGGRRNILWNNFGSHHAFTTGRQRASETNFGNKVRPKGPSQTLKVKNEVRSFLWEFLNSKSDGLMKKLTYVFRLIYSNPVN